MSQPKLISAEASGLLELRLVYETGDFDASPYAHGAWYSELQNGVFPHGTPYRRRRGDCVGARSGPRAARTLRTQPRRLSRADGFRTREKSSSVSSWRNGAYCPSVPAWGQIGGFP